jgi:hypothetical protein
MLPYIFHLIFVCFDSAGDKKHMLFLKNGNVKEMNMCLVKEKK